MLRASFGVPLGTAACLIGMAGCTLLPPDPIDPAALLPKESVVVLARHPSALLRTTLDGLLPGALPAEEFATLAVVHDGDSVGWIGFTPPVNTRTSRLPTMRASSPSVLALVGTGADTLIGDAFYRGSAAAARDVRSWAFIAEPMENSPLALHPVTLLTDTGALALLWMDQRPLATASVGSVVPALPSRMALWFADGRVLASVTSVLRPDVALSFEALTSALALQTFGQSTDVRDIAGLVDGPGALFVGPRSFTGTSILLTGNARENVAPLLTDIRRRFDDSRPQMEVEAREYERGFRSTVLHLSDTPIADNVRHDGPWTVHALHESFDDATLITAETSEAFVIGTDAVAVDALLGAGTGSLALPPLVAGFQREAAGTFDADVLPPSLAQALSPLLQPLGARRILWSLDRTGGATALTLRAE